MPKKLPFFKFDTDDYLTGKIQLCDYTTQGVFVNICARIWRNNGTLINDTLLSRKLRLDQGVFNQCLTYLKELEIIQEKDGILSVKFISIQINKNAKFREKCSLNGKKSAAVRKVPSTKKSVECRMKNEDKINKLIKEFKEFGWLADFNKVFKDIPFEAIECYWKNHLSKSVENISPEYRAKHITKQIKENSIKFYDEYKKTAACKNKELQEQKEYSCLLISGATIWSLQTPEEKQTIFSEFIKETDLVSTLTQKGEISNKHLEEIIFSKLGEKREEFNAAHTTLIN